MKTRKDYMEHRCTHREYYAQFVTEATRRRVIQAFGVDRLRASEDPHLNDIPLARWDRVDVPAPPISLEDCGDWLSPAGAVCILKEAARQIIEATDAY